MWKLDIRRIHFVGIGGIGMSGIAEICIRLGCEVSGSDQTSNKMTARLEKLGAKVNLGHSAENIENAELVVYSSAAPEDNPELIESRKRNIQTIKRADMLAMLMNGKKGICVAGVHGKTTTTTMIGAILIEAGLDPSVIVGGIAPEFGETNCRLGKSEYIIIEADEYDRTFLKLTPAISIVTNIEAEHLDIYKDIDDIRGAFTEFINKTSSSGFAAVCADDAEINKIIKDLKCRVISYGVSKEAKYRAENIVFEKNSSRFDAVFENKKMGTVELNIPGLHNIKNSMAAIVAANELGVPFETIAKALNLFRGVGRRFEIKYEGEALVVDDYAHHPGEVEASLKAIKNGWNRRIVAAFQPHLYSRTKEFYKEFAKAFMEADVFICLDVYPARETPIAGITGKLIVDEAKKLGHINAIYEENKNNLPALLQGVLKKDDIIITMGAGDITKYNDKFVELLKNK